MSQGFRCEPQEKTLAELLHRRKPFRHLSQRSTAHGKADVLKLVGRQRSRLEPRKAIQAGDFAKSVDCDERHYSACSGIYDTINFNIDAR
jgi:hypothetical protein